VIRDWEKSENSLREVREVVQGAKQMLQGYSDRFERMSLDMGRHAESLQTAVTRVQAVEDDNRKRREADERAREAQNARWSTIQFIVGTLLVLSSFWGGKVATGLQELLKILPGRIAG
jgi:hypothetical protein